MVSKKNTENDEGNLIDPSILYAVERITMMDQSIKLQRTDVVVGTIECKPNGFNRNEKRSPPNTTHNVFVGDELKISLTFPNPNQLQQINNHQFHPYLNRVYQKELETTIPFLNPTESFFITEDTNSTVRNELMIPEELTSNSSNNNNQITTSLETDFNQVLATHSIFCQLIINDQQLAVEKQFNELNEVSVFIPRCNKGGAGGKSRVGKLKLVCKEEGSQQKEVTEQVIAISNCFWIRTKTRKETVTNIGSNNTSSVGKKKESNGYKRELKETTMVNNNTKKKKIIKDSTSDISSSSGEDENTICGEVSSNNSESKQSPDEFLKFLDENNFQTTNDNNKVVLDQQAILQVKNENLELKKRVQHLEQLVQDILLGKIPINSTSNNTQTSNSKQNLVEQQPKKSNVHLSVSIPSPNFIEQYSPNGEILSNNTSPFCSRSETIGFQPHYSPIGFVSDTLSPTSLFFVSSPPRDDWCVRTEDEYFNL
ncbi:hypothetical protein ABK040_006725 [Willaertia magna]